MSTRNEKIVISLLIVAAFAAIFWKYSGVQALGIRTIESSWTLPLLAAGISASVSLADAVGYTYFLHTFGIAGIIDIYILVC